MLSIFDPTYFMREALKEAEQAYNEGEVPIGAVVVLENRIIARAHNATERLNDVTAHAEMLAITAAAEHLGNKYLAQCTIYVTLEPCVMCGGALAWSQIGKVVYGAADEKRGYTHLHKPILHPKTSVAYGVLEAECTALIRRFFASKR